MSAGADGKRVVIVDDHPVMIYGLSEFLKKHGNYNVCAQFGQGKELIDAIDGIRADVIIIDLCLGDRDGLDLIKDIKSLNVAIPILAYSFKSERIYAERAIKAGAMGYIEKSASGELLLEALEAVIKGDIWLSEECGKMFMNRMANGSGPEDVCTGADQLTDRELEVFEMEGEGHSTIQIADRMGLSPKTVETYKHKIKSKLNLKNHVELRCQAVEWVLHEQRKRR